MYLVLWEFFVRPGSEDEFGRIYGSSGDWARLFATCPGYQGTELLADSDPSGAEGRRYVTIDRWSSARDFANFQSACDEEYKTLDARCEGLTIREAGLGNCESEAQKGA